MAKYVAGFIGCGNMGGPLIRAVSKILNPIDIAVCGRNKERANGFAQTLGVVSTTKEDIAENAAWIFLGVKPQSQPEVISEIRGILKNRKDDFIIVTMAAGKKISSVAELLGLDCKIFRIMPNTPVSVGSGMTTYCCNNLVTAEDIMEFMSVMQYTGRVEKLEEDLMDAGCSVAGCGPAFTFMFIDALAKGGEECGLRREDAIALAAQTVAGSAALLISENESPEVLKDRVCSPGGSTIEGVKSLTKDSFEDVVKQAVIESNKRNIELGE